MTEKLKGSRFGSEESVKSITEKFDETSKRTFKNAADTVHIQFGSVDTRDDQYGIRGGKLRLAGYVSFAQGRHRITEILLQC
jgi:hypothetical protein